MGIITLEDVIEELIGEEIVDETDLYIDVHKRIAVARARTNLFRQNTSDLSADESGAKIGRRSWYKNRSDSQPQASLLIVY